MQVKSPQIMQVAHIQHLDANGICLWEDFNVGNVWHVEGQEFVLAVVFDTDYGASIPSNYYLGLDNRTTLAASDSLTDLSNEPSTNGYARIAASSATGFAVATESGVMKAKSSIVTFSATGGSWGPVRNLFLATSLNNSGYLIASSRLSSTRTVLSGESLTARINLSLASCT